MKAKTGGTSSYKSLGCLTKNQFPCKQRVHFKQFWCSQWRLNKDFNWITNFVQRDVTNGKLFHQKFISVYPGQIVHPPWSNIVVANISRFLTKANFPPENIFSAISALVSAQMFRTYHEKENCFCQSIFLKIQEKFFIWHKAARWLGERSWKQMSVEYSKTWKSERKQELGMASLLLLAD